MSNLAVWGWESMGWKKASQARRPDQKHGRDGKGFLGCLIFSHAKPLLLDFVLLPLPIPVVRPGRPDAAP